MVAIDGEPGESCVDDPADVLTDAIGRRTDACRDDRVDAIGADHDRRRNRPLHAAALDDDAAHASIAVAPEIPHANAIGDLCA